MVEGLEEPKFDTQLCMEEVFDQALSILNPRLELVLRLRYGLGGQPEMTMAAVGRELGISHTRADQLHAKAVRYLRASPHYRRILRSFVERKSVQEMALARQEDMRWRNQLGVPVGHPGILSQAAHKVDTLVIVKTEWARGLFTAGLRTTLGRLSSLGFYGKALGYSNSMLEWAKTPADLVRKEHGIVQRKSNKRNLFPDWLVRCNLKTYRFEDTKACLALMRVNDVGFGKLVGNEDIREKKIFELFAKYGVEVVFR